MFKGYDVSKHNNFYSLVNSGVLSSCDFLLIRCGYGRYPNQFDENCKKFVDFCEKNCIPWALYWYSYAKSEKAVVEECNTIKTVIKNLGIKPKTIFYDLEENYHIKNIAKYISIFDYEMKLCGIKSGLYANVSMLKNESTHIFSCDFLWVAHWTSHDKPNYNDNWDIWQYNSETIDKNYAKSLEPFYCCANKDYLVVIKDIIDGKYGNGTERKKALTANGIEYEKAQHLVNEYIKIAEEIYKGKYGNGNERKKKLEESNIDYKTAQFFVNKIYYN